MKDLLDRLVEAVVLRDVAETRRLAAALPEEAAVSGLRALVLRLGDAPSADAWMDIETAFGSIEDGSPREADPDLLASFLAEAREHLANAEARLLMIEARPSDPEGIREVFRALDGVEGGGVPGGVPGVLRAPHPLKG